MSDFFPIAILFGLSLALAAVFLALPHILTRQRPTREKRMTYECGMDPVGDARGRYSVQFYVVAMMFILFDVEVVFLYPWAVAFRELLLFGFIEALLFLAVLMVGYVYLWRRGVFEWD